MMHVFVAWQGRERLLQRASALLHFLGQCHKAWSVLELEFRFVRKASKHQKCLQIVDIPNESANKTFSLMQQEIDMSLHFVIQQIADALSEILVRNCMMTQITPYPARELRGGHWIRRQPLSSKNVHGTVFHAWSFDAAIEILRGTTIAAPASSTHGTQRMCVD